jgi:heat induced stress protein YflT
MPTDKTDGPQKVVLGSYSSHPAAQRVVDILAERDFPVEHVTIVGTNLKLQEMVLGRWTLGRALVSGAFTGGWIGLLIGLVFLIVRPWAVQSLGPAILIGIVLGLIWAAVARMWQRRSFAAVPAVVADRYDVLVDAPFADEARRVVSAALGAPADRPARPT